MTEKEKQGIKSIIVKGYKSIHDAKINIKPLTILSGVNSSGKTSIMQPLLLLKQTFDKQFNPGVLWLNGPNVTFSEFNQLECRCKCKKKSLSIGFESYNGDQVIQEYLYNEDKKQIDLGFQTIIKKDKQQKKIVIRKQMSKDKIKELFSDKIEKEHIFKERKLRYKINSERAFLNASVDTSLSENDDESYPRIGISFSPINVLRKEVIRLIHISGFRGNPQRSYPVSNIESPFPGLFHEYIASILLSWKKESENLRKLNCQLQDLRLGYCIEAQSKDDTSIEIRISRNPYSDDETDLVNLADVGFGVSQVLPILIALLVAEEGQIVYIEQPELHLHPNAQLKLAKHIVNAAEENKAKIVIETHSELFLVGLQIEIADRAKRRSEKCIDFSDIGLNWFTIDPVTGKSIISSGAPDEYGRFGDWPIDFAETAMKAKKKFLDIVWKNTM